MEHQLFQNGDIIIVRRGLVGRMDTFESDEPYIANEHIVVANKGWAGTLFEMHLQKKNQIKNLAHRAMLTVRTVDPLVLGI